MKDKNTQQKNCIVLDFDGTLFYNPSKNFSIDIAPHNIIDAKRFFSHLFLHTEITIDKNSDFVLITGRPERQKPFILELLRQKGYKFTQAYFRTLDTSLTPINEQAFLKYYREGKVNIISHIRERSHYDNIYVFEDDQELCYMLHQVGFKVFQVVLYSPLFKNAIELIPYSFVPYPYIKLQRRGNILWERQ
ncbi:MAG: hypothetical protein ACFFBT_04645 [Promethearchaeota archaeon]